MNEPRYDETLQEMWTSEPFLTLGDDICRLAQNYAVRTGMRLHEVVLAPLSGIEDDTVMHVHTPTGLVAVRFHRK